MPSFLGTIAGIGKAYQTIGGVASGFGMKVPGIPSPGKTGAALGRDVRDYMNAAYPGTNPWEHLGAPGYAGSGVEAGKTAAAQQERQLRVQERMQEKELETRKDVAATQARATVISSGAAVGADAVNSLLGTLAGRSGREYTTAVTIAGRKVGAELRKLSAETRNIMAQEADNLNKAIISRNEAAIRNAAMEWKESLVRGHVAEKLGKNVPTALINWLDALAQASKQGAKGFGEALNQVESSVKDKGPPKFTTQHGF